MKKMDKEKQVVLKIDGRNTIYSFGDKGCLVSNGKGFTSSKSLDYKEFINALELKNIEYIIKKVEYPTLGM